MSIASEITRINTNIAAAYSACDNKGATMPQTQNSANLANTIGSISSGGGTSALDAYIDGSETDIVSNASSIKVKAFYGDGTITSGSFPSATRMGVSAFESCSRLTSISAPNLTTLDTTAFYNCSRLSSVTLPKASSIPGQVFRNCAALTALDLPLCTSVGYMGLCSCTNLVSVNMPNLVTIGQLAFANCSALTSIDLHNISVLNGDSCFGDCSQFTVLILRRTVGVCPLGNVNVFAYTPFRNGTGGTVYVPQALLNSYQSATNWSALESTTFLPIEGSIYEEA